MTGPVPASASTPSLRPGQPACRFCGTPLDPHQAARGGICDAPHCETRRVQEAGRHVFHRDWYDYVERQRSAVQAAANELAAAARELGGEPERVAYGVVPRLERPVVALPGARRARFAAHLETVIGEAFAGDPPLPSAADLERRETAERPEHPLIGATCATCGGACCMIGGVRHAFLDADTIRLHRRRHLGASADDVRAHYLGRLPGRSVEHSCVYHGPQGCVLSRDERADICNRYHCNPQMHLLTRFRDMGTSRAVILAQEDGTGRALATYDSERGWRPFAMPETSASEPAPDGRAAAAALAQVPQHLPAEGGSVPAAAPVCAWCGIPIGRHKAVTTRSCGRPACESRRTAEVSARVEHRRHEQQLALVAAMEKAWAPQLDGAAAALGAARGSLVVGVVPRQDTAIMPLPPPRRAAFEAHLAAVAAEGFAIARPEDHWSPDSAADQGMPETGLAVAACSTCQGWCCRMGAPQMAFLTARDVCRYRLTAPSPTAEGFVTRYLALLPAASVADACVFQGRAGCTVPRSERSHICNGHHCTGLRALLQSWDRAGPGAAAAIIAEEDEMPRALGLYDQGGGWRMAIRPENLSGDPPPG